MNKDYMAFLYACTVIGGVSESNGRFQELMYRTIGDKWADMTVTELLVHIQIASDTFNSVEKFARGES